MTRPAMPGGELRAAILNLPCKPTGIWTFADAAFYRRGHRDARHAAAELVSPAAAQVSAPAAEKLWCETCDGTGEVYQEPQIGCHVGGDHPCPDCDGLGYIARHAAAPVSAAAAAPAVARTWLLSHFPQTTLRDIAEGLDKGYEQRINVGEDCPAVESTTAYAARFIRAYLLALAIPAQQDGEQR